MNIVEKSAYTKLSDTQLKKLATMRLQNQKANITITSIKIEDKRISKVHNEYAVSFIVKSKEWADHRINIVFEKFYPNEFLFLQDCGIDFREL